MYVDKPFTKDNLDRYLKELAKLNKNNLAEILKAAKAKR